MPIKWKHKSILKLIKESENNDPINEIRERARHLVLKAFELGWEGPPYSPIELAKLLNIEVFPNDSVIDARIVPIKKNHLQIQYNPYQKPTRINFSIAHEIAHTLFSDCGDEIRNRETDPKSNNELEQLCNIAASEIQLPYAVFSNDVKNAIPSIEGLINLATKYRASLESVFIRYTEIIDSPCAVLIGRFQSDTKIVVDYYKTSKYLNLEIPDEFIIPNESKAYECISPGWTARETSDWKIFNKHQFNIYSIGISPYRRDNKPRVGILIFPYNQQNKLIEEGKVVLEYGDATKPRGKDTKIIAQVVNTSGGLGIGFGKALSKNYPIIKSELEKWAKDKHRYHLGSTNLVTINATTYIFQMLAQKGLFSSGGEIPLKYADLRKCLIELAETAVELKASIHMPQIGAGQAKGDWNIILGMIYEELVSKGIKVNIYLLPGKVYNPKIRSNLTIFKENSTWVTEKLF